jgi:hypothetical protein
MLCFCFGRFFAKLGINIRGQIAVHLDFFAIMNTIVIDIWICNAGTTEALILAHRLLCRGVGVKKTRHFC